MQNQLSRDFKFREVILFKTDINPYDKFILKSNVKKKQNEELLCSEYIIFQQMKNNLVSNTREYITEIFLYNVFITKKFKFLTYKQLLDR